MAEDNKQPTTTNKTPAPADNKTAAPAEPSTPTEPTTPPEPPKLTNTSANSKEETVTVPKSVLTQVLNSIETLKQEREADRATIEKLSFAADKGRIDLFESRQDKGELIRTEHIGLWENESGKYYILGWKLSKNEVYVDGQGKVVEKQEMTLFLIDEKFTSQSESDIKEQVIPYASFYQNRDRVLCNVIREVSDKSKGTHAHVLQLPDGRELEVDVNFVNA